VGETFVSPTRALTFAKWTSILCFFGKGVNMKSETELHRTQSMQPYRSRHTIRGADWGETDETDILTDAQTGLRQHAPTGSLHEHRNGFDILHLYGTPYERGLAHGKLLKAKISGSHVAEYYGSFVRDLYRSSDFARRIPGAFRRHIGSMLEWWFYAPLEKACMSETREEMEGIADGAGIDRSLALRGLLAPDVLETLAAGFLKSGKQSLGNYYLGGCSSAFARRTACRDPKGSLFARNMDFPGVFVWRHPAIIFSHPSESVDTYVRSPDGGIEMRNKRKQPYLYISTAGFPGIGLTGMNEAGVAMGSYVCLSRNVSRTDPLFLDYNHFLLTRTEGLDGIEHVVRTQRSRSASPHTVMFVDKDDALTVEVDSRRAVLRRCPQDFDIAVQTNHFQNPLMKSRELEYPLERENTLGRFRLIQSALEKSYGDISVQGMIDIISGNIDMASRKPVMIGDIPAQPATLTSVVFDLRAGTVWVAGGNPPAVCYNSYYGFNFTDELSRGKSRNGLRPLRRSREPVIDGVESAEVTGNMKYSLKLLMLSQEMLKQGKRRYAIRLLRKARRIYEDPGYAYVLGIVLLSDGQYDEALSLLCETETNNVFPYVKTTALSLWIARAFDLLGRRSDAIIRYQKMLEDQNLLPHLRSVARKGLRRPFSSKQVPASFDYGSFGPFLF
jgi:hypothetical protein